MNKSANPKSFKRKKKLRRTQEERTSTTTASILAATQNCLFELGYAATTMSAIAKRAGVTSGALQHHFGSRANIFKALIDEFYNSLSRFEEPTIESLSAQQRKEFIREAFRFYGTALPVTIMLLRINIQAEPDLRDIIEAKFGPLNTLRNNVWNRLFRAAGLNVREVDLMRETVIATLRGFAVRQAYQRKLSSIEPELSLIEEMIELYVAKHSKGTSRNSGPAPQSGLTKSRTDKATGLKSLSS